MYYLLFLYNFFLLCSHCIFLHEKGTSLHKVPGKGLCINKHCRVAKALLAVASVDATVVLTIVVQM